MKKNLTKIFSTVLAAATALSVSAAPLAKKVSAPTGVAAATAVVKAQQKPAKATGNRFVTTGLRNVRTVSDANVFKSATARKNMPVKAPLKVGYHASDAMPDLLGSVIYSDAWSQSEAPVGLYSIPTSAAQEFELKISGPSATYGGVLVDGIYYVCNVETFYGYILGVYYEGYDMETGEKVYDKDFSYYTNSLTYDATTSTIYGVSTVEDTPCIVEVEFADSEVVFNPVAVLDVEELGLWNSIACDAEGNLWGIFGNYVQVGSEYACVGSSLYKIDKTSGACTKVGDTGYDTTYASDCTFDTKTNRLFWTIAPSDECGYIAEVNTETGAATVLYQFPNGEEVAGLAIAAPAAEEGAPAVVENLAVEFEGASLSGKVSFTAPATTFDGNEATGDITYYVTANDEALATGTVAYGAEVSADVVVAEAGSYTFVVYTTNAVGDSPKAKAKKYVGNDVPEAPVATATVDTETGVATVTWTPVVAGVHGGYLDAAAVTYDVTRYPGAVAVATDITETTVTEQLEVPETGMVKYFYEVVAKCNGLSSNEALTGYVKLGGDVFVPPFVDTFDDFSESYTVIDANGDGKTWSLSNGNMRVTYNTSLDMDDWLISPAVQLQAGKLYDVLADIWSQGTSFPERIEVKMGTAPTVEAMTTVILEPTEFANGSSNVYNMSVPVSVEADGKYYIGFHGMSDKDMYYLNVDNFGVSAPYSALSPAAPEDLTLAADPAGAPVVEVSLTAPTKAINGSELTSLDKVELSREGEVINTWENVAPGDVLTYTDNLTEGGTYLYSAVAYNAEGMGLVAELSVFVGFNIPSAPANVDLVESPETYGEVTLTWDAVTTDVDGRDISNEEVTYQVYAVDGYYRTPVSDKISETTFTFQAVAPGEQDFVEYLVFAYNNTGESSGQYSPFMAVGTPYTSFSMTSSEDLSTYLLGTSSAGGAQWSVGTDETFSDVTDVDGNSFYLMMKGQYLDQYATLFTGKIDLSATVNPGMVFYNMPIAEDDVNVITLSVTDLATGEETVVYEKTAAESGTPMEWNKVTVDLQAFAGKTVQVTLMGTVGAYQYIFIDGWKVVSLLDYDLAASIAAPAKVAAGSDFNVDVTVENVGTKETALFSVDLYADGVIVETKQCNGLKAGASVAVTFAQSFSALAVEPVVYTAKVVYPSDMNTANDEATVTVVPVVSKLPAVTDLEGKVEEAAVVLTWSEPDLNGAAGEPVTEDFEDAEAFSATYGDWIFVDGDQAQVGGFQGTDIPGITPGTTAGSFWIWDQAQLGNQTFEAHSGTKYLFALFRYDDGTTDDWAISPVLDGNAQTVSFYAKSYSSTYPEKIEVYYSTGSTETSDFVKVEGVGGVVPGDWTLYSADLPEGATRFAIRSCATGSFMLMVDDVTYVPAGAAANLDLVGYNVYRDGVKINDAVVEENTYSDANVEDGKTYSYVVTVVYSKGESAASNVAEVTYALVGIDNIYGKALNISAAKNNIIVTGAAGLNVAVYTVDGKTIFSGAGEAKTVIPAQQGVYVVKAGNTVKKVLVK